MAQDLDRLQKHKTLWLQIYAYYGLPLQQPRLGWFAQDMLAYDPETVADALELYRTTPPPTGHKPRAPIPTDIIAMLTEYVAPEHEANELAAAIFGSIGRIGYNHPDKAQAHLGPDAWAVVLLMGGWVNVCQSAQADDRAAFHAQARDIAKGVLQRRQNARVTPSRRLTPGEQKALAAPAPEVVPAPVERPQPSPQAFAYFNDLVQDLMSKVGACHTAS